MNQQNPNVPYNQQLGQLQAASPLQQAEWMYRQQAQLGHQQQQRQQTYQQQMAGMQQWPPPETYDGWVPEDELAYEGVLNRWPDYGAIGRMLQGLPTRKPSHSIGFCQRAMFR